MSVYKSGSRYLLNGNSEWVVGYKIYSDGILKYNYPIGPVPENWQKVDACSRNLPHNECSEWWQNVEMNNDHKIRPSYWDNVPS